MKQAMRLLNTGKLYAFGDNANNLVGKEYNESKASQQFYKIPVLVGIPDLNAGEKVVSVHASVEHALLVTSTGRVFSWGKNNIYGQLGNSPRVDGLFYIPREVNFTGILYGEKIINVRAYGDSSFAITNFGRVFAWGQNWHNELGIRKISSEGLPVLWDDIYFEKTDYRYEYYDYQEMINKWSPSVPEGMEFSGWFIDQAMTIPYTGTRCPLEGISLYGKLDWKD